MKVMVGHDTDGHFFCVPIDSRAKVMTVLQEVLEDGDTWQNTDMSEYSGLSIKEMGELDWLDFVKLFTQRGLMEIVEL